jgi:hypothetical protein
VKKAKRVRQVCGAAIRLGSASESRYLRADFSLFELMLELGVEMDLLGERLQQLADELMGRVVGRTRPESSRCGGTR